MLLVLVYKNIRFFSILKEQLFFAVTKTINRRVRVNPHTLDYHAQLAATATLQDTNHLQEKQGK